MGEVIGAHRAEREWDVREQRDPDQRAEVSLMRVRVHWVGEKHEHVHLPLHDAGTNLHVSAFRTASQPLDAERGASPLDFFSTGTGTEKDVTGEPILPPPCPSDQGILFGVVRDKRDTQVLSHTGLLNRKRHNVQRRTRMARCCMTSTQRHGLPIVWR
jgi:hypothetical protein